MDEKDEENMFSKGISEMILKDIEEDVEQKYSDYVCIRRRSKHKADSHRKGPAPIDDRGLAKKTSQFFYSYGTLDSDLEDLTLEDASPFSAHKKNFHSLASCRAMIVYFSKVAKTSNEDEKIDLNFVESLLENGGDINFSDKHGQTILHEISRAWHPDIAHFALQHGADIDKPDCYGRTPLHLAAAVDYVEMVEFLIDNGANYDVITDGENQTPLHYAAKNNAIGALKTLLRLGANINVRDYKDRTPLFVAAENARAEAARFLIEQGAPCGLYDSSGTTCLSLMIEKMPQVAIEAVEQFHIMDRAFRKHYYYLSYLESDPKFLPDPMPEEKRELRDFQQRKKQELKEQKETGQKMQKKPRTYAKTPLEVIIQYNQLELIMHPVFQRLTYVKWNLFGKWGSAKMLSLNLYYTLVWTFLGILMPKNQEYYNPFQSNWWRLLLEINGVGLTIYFIFMEISQVRNNESVHNRWTHWKTRHMEKDLQFCHPRWPEEKQYLSAELEQIRSYHRTYFRDPWNIFEWVAYVVVLTLVITRILSVASNDSTAERLHPRLYSLGLIVIWLRFMRSCRVFRTLGPFIAILGSVINDTMKFAFLFFEFFIPYTVAFWIIFGANSGSTITHDDWTKFNDLVYSVWSMTLMGQYNWETLVTVDRLMAQILCGTYFALAGVVCMNLYIALLSDTFARVYAQAHANAVMQQAKCIIMLEGKLTKYNKSKCAYYMQTYCSPQEVYYRDDPNIGEDIEQDKFNRVSRQIISRINTLEDTIQINLTAQIEKDVVRRNAIGALTDMDAMKGRRGTVTAIGEDKSLTKFFREQNVFNREVKRELEDLKELINDIKTLMHRGRVQSSSDRMTPLVHISHNDDQMSEGNMAGEGNQNSILKVPHIEVNDGSSKHLAAPISPMNPKSVSRPRTPQVNVPTAQVLAENEYAKRVLSWVLPTKNKMGDGGKSDNKGIPNWYQLTETLQQRKQQQQPQTAQQGEKKEEDEDGEHQQQLGEGFRPPKSPRLQPLSKDDDPKYHSGLSIEVPPAEKPVKRDLNLEIGNALRLYPAIPVSLADSDSQERDLNLEIGNALRSMPTLPASFEDTDLESITSSRSQGNFKRSKRRKRSKRSPIGGNLSEPDTITSENTHLIRNDVSRIHEDDELPMSSDDEL